MRRAFFSDFYLNACYTIARKSKKGVAAFFCEREAVKYAEYKKK